MSRQHHYLKIKPEYYRAIEYGSKSTVAKWKRKLKQLKGDKE